MLRITVRFIKKEHLTVRRLNYVYNAQYLIFFQIDVPITNPKYYWQGQIRPGAVYAPVIHYLIQEMNDG